MSAVVDKQLRFEIEWERADGVQAPELAATWARFELWIGDECVTQVEDVETRSARRSIYSPLYPLAEWVAYNWWLLRANVRPGAFPSAAFSRPSWPAVRPWLRGHNVRAAGDGYVWPNLTVLPEGPATRWLWHADRSALPGAPIRYLGTGEARVSSSETERALADVVEAVLTRLDEEHVHDVPLREEWAAVTASDSDEADFCLAAAKLGQDPYSLTGSIETALLAAANTLSDSLLPDFLDVVSPERVSESLAWLVRSDRAISEERNTPLARLDELRSRLAPKPASPSDLPWIQGWREAAAARKLLELNQSERFDISEIFTVKHRAGDDSHLQALGGLTSAGGGVLVLSRTLRGSDLRFAQARALRHVASAWPSRFLLTSSPAYESRVERAFAAELLAPAEGIRGVLGDPEGSVVSIQALDRVAKHFAVNPFVVRHQVENQLNLATVA